VIPELMTDPPAWLRPPPLRRCDVCGADLGPADWRTVDGCRWCDAGIDILTPWGQS
jgi:hypothetical protein